MKRHRYKKSRSGRIRKNRDDGKKPKKSICPACNGYKTARYKWTGFGYNGVRAYTKVCLDCGTSFDIDRS